MSAEGGAGLLTNLTEAVPCNDHTHPDGEGYMSRQGGTAPTVAEVVERMNEMDWTEGVKILQVRVAPTSAAACRTQIIGGGCLPDRSSPEFVEETRPFGRNWSHPTAPLTRPFQWHSSSDLGASPTFYSASAGSGFRDYPGSGFAAFVIPFFATAYLPEERGSSSEITDFRSHRALRTNSKQPAYFCVRLSWDGLHIHQLCDPNDEHGRTTGVVRAAVLEFWNDLKRAHYIDANTRALMVHIPLTSNYVGVSASVRLIFEFTGSGSVLPSYDSMTSVTNLESLEKTELFLLIGLGFACFSEAHTMHAFAHVHALKALSELCIVCGTGASSPSWSSSRYSAWRMVSLR